jgi:hypothetical protein
LRNNLIYILFIFFITSSIINKSNNCIAQTGNYVKNGSFEDYYSCYLPNHIGVAKGWRTIDSSLYGPQQFLSTCYPNVPYNGFGFQWPRTGENLCGASFLCEGTLCSVSGDRGYIRNRLKSNLIQGKIYCVKFYVNINNNSQYGIDGFGAYFGDDSIDTITVVSKPLIYLIPQITNPTNNIITDTLNWTIVTGTFVANGTEKHLIIGNFKSDAFTNKIQIDTSYSPHVFTDVCIDDVSCIELNLPAYAGSDKSIIPGDSVYIGRESDFAIDPGCIWFKLPNMTTAIDTISGLWVKPSSTSTYVVKQTLDCSPEKWDTVVVYMNLVGIEKLRMLNEELRIYPVPAKDFIELKISNRALFEGFNSIALYNNLGQLIKEEEISFKEDKLIISTIDFKPGVYVLKIKSNTYGTVSQRFVISQYH